MEWHKAARLMWTATENGILFNVLGLDGKWYWRSEQQPSLMGPFDSAELAQSAAEEWLQAHP